MTFKELIRFAYGLFMGTSTPYLKPTKRFLFPTSVYAFDEGLSLLLGGSGICAVLRGERELLVINTNQGGAAQQLRDELVDPWLASKEGAESGAARLTVVLTSAVPEFSAGLDRFTDAARILVAEGAGRVLREAHEALANRMEGVAERRVLEIGEERVHLVSIPAAATGSDLAVFLEKRSLLFLGPLFFNRIQPVLRAGASLRPREWAAALEALLAKFEPQHVVPAEGDLGSQEDVREFIRYLRALSDPAVEFSYCRSNFDWPEIPGTTSLEENFDLVRGVKSHTTLG